MMTTWSNYVYISDDSPTGLRWKINVLDSRGHQTKARKDGIAGGGSGPSGYQVQLRDSQVQCSRVVWELVNGSIPEGYVVDHVDGDRLNNSIENLELKTVSRNNRNVKKSTANTSGKTGVFFTKNRVGTEIAEARWYDNGKARSRTFSIAKYGRDEAFALACKVRDEAINTLNANGAGYTERHGT